MLRALVACCACLLGAPAIATAEWHISPMVGLTFAGKTTLTDFDEATGKVHPNLSLSGALLGGGLLGVEAITSVTPGFFGSKGTFVETSRLTTLMGNLVVTAPQHLTEYGLRPFVSGGFGLMRISKVETTCPTTVVICTPRPLPDILSFTENLLGYNIGGGAIGFFSRSTGIRFDARFYGTLRGSDRGPIALGDVNLRYMTASVGLVIRR
jgi:hypothetical protein